MNYKKIYDSIIEHRLTNILPQSCDLYTERHHILPHSLGGSDELYNIVRLTSREHFICHSLLARMYPYKSFKWWRMTKAIEAMKMYTNKHVKRYLNSRLYEKIKSDYWRAVNEEHEINSLKSIKKICKFIEKYNRPPIGNSKNKHERKLANKLGDLKKGKKYVNGKVSRCHNFFPSYQTLANELGFPYLYETFDYEANGLNILKDICDWVIENKRKPKRNSDDIIEVRLAGRLSDIKKAKNGIRGLFFESYNEYIISRNCDNLFESKFDISYKICIELCEWIKINDRPNTNSKGREQILANKLIRIKQLYKNDKLDERIIKLFIDNGCFIYLEDDDIVYKERVRELCEWIKINEIPNPKDDEYRFYTYLKKRFNKNTLPISSIELIKEYNMMYILKTSEELYNERFEEMCKWFETNKRIPLYNSTDKYERYIYSLYVNSKQRYNNGKCTEKEIKLLTSYDIIMYFKPQIEIYYDKIRALCIYMNVNNRKPSIATGTKEIKAMGKLLSRLRTKIRDNKIDDEILEIIKEYNCEVQLGIN